MLLYGGLKYGRPEASRGGLPPGPLAYIAKVVPVGLGMRASASSPGITRCQLQALIEGTYRKPEVGSATGGA